MKINNHSKDIMDKAKYLIIAFFLYCICFIALLAVFVIQNFIGRDLLGKFFSACVLLVIFSLASKIFFKTSYSGLVKEIKLNKYDFIDNLVITALFSSVFGFINILIYHIDFIINQNKTKSISYFIKSLTSNNSYVNSSLHILIGVIIIVISVAEEELFFRYTAYKIFVKKKDDIKIFIILTSIVFGFSHDLSFSPRFFATVVISIFLSIIYVITKSVVYAFISHFLWDFFVSIASGFMIYFKNVNTSIFAVQGIIAEIMIICLLVLLSFYSYFKRGYILSLKTRNKIHHIKRRI